MMNQQLSTLKFNIEKFNKAGISCDQTVNKPDGGFWTSSDRGNGKSDWIAYCERTYQSALTGETFSYQIDSNARILSAANAQEYVIEHPVYRGRYIIDWDRVASEFDGFHFNYDGNSGLFWGWDVESYVWFNPEVING